MIELILIRHGETEYNKEMKFLGHLHLPLNETGRDQAQNLAKIINKEVPNRIYCSDLERCVETARILFPEQNIEYTETLREMDFGVFEGLTYSEIKKQQTEELALWKKNRSDHKISGGESFSDMSKRVLKQINLIKENGEGKYIIISHSGCIRTILSYYLLGKVEDLWLFMIDNCKISRLIIGENYAYLKSLNEG